MPSDIWYQISMHKEKIDLAVSVVCGLNVGVFCGVFVALAVCTGFAFMILSSLFNIYYALVFFLVGGFYAYKIMRKN